MHQVDIKGGTVLLAVLAYNEQQKDHEKLDALTKAEKALNDDVDSVKKLNGDVASSGERRPSKLLTMPSCISLHSDAFDLTFDNGDEQDKK